MTGRLCEVGSIPSLPITPLIRRILKKAAGLAGGKNPMACREKGPDQPSLCAAACSGMGLVDVTVFRPGHVSQTA